MSELRVDERVEGGWLPYSSELCVEHWFGFIPSRLCFVAGMVAGCRP